MLKFKLSPVEKKSASETEFYTKTIDGKEFTIEYETGWRWAEVIFEIEKPDFGFIDLRNTYSCDPFCGLEVTDSSCDDGCWDEYRFPYDMPTDEVERIENLVSEKGKWVLDQEGWDLSHSEMVFVGPLMITDIDGTVIADGSKEAPSAFDRPSCLEGKKTSWIPFETHPVHVGMYEIYDELKSQIFMLLWNGKNWIRKNGNVYTSTDQHEWRGLNKKPQAIVG